MRVGIEATSMLGRRSGVGQTTASLAAAIVEVDPDVEVVLVPITVRGTWRLRTRHPRITTVRPKIPARAAGWVWSRVEWPPAELICGAVDVFHGPNYLLPPLVKAAGVVTVHDLAFVHVPEACSPAVRAYAHTVPAAVKRAARVIVPSAFTAEELTAWLPDAAGRIRVVPMAVREEFLTGGPLSPPRLGELGIAGPYVLFVGTLEMRKNVAVLLEAWAGVDTAETLVLAGQPGVGWEQVAAAHEGLLSSGRVRVTGYLPDGEVAALVRGARTLVYPSSYEGFGLPPLEAMAAGTPVIATNAGALAETLGGHARLVEPGDAAALAAALAEPPPAQDAVDRARRWAKDFTWARTARQTLRVYREAISEQAA